MKIADHSTTANNTVSIPPRNPLDCLRSGPRSLKQCLRTIGVLIDEQRRAHRGSSTSFGRCTAEVCVEGWARGRIVFGNGVAEAVD